MTRAFQPRSGKPFPPLRGQIWQVHLQLVPDRKPNGSKCKEPPGTHPALVLSDNRFNQRGLAIVTFISSQDHAPEHSVRLHVDRQAGADGYISPYDVHALDWETRFVALLGTCPREEADEITRRLLVLLVDDQLLARAIASWSR